METTDLDVALPSGLDTLYVGNRYDGLDPGAVIVASIHGFSETHEEAEALDVSEWIAADLGV